MWAFARGKMDGNLMSWRHSSPNCPYPRGCRAGPLHTGPRQAGATARPPFRAGDTEAWRGCYIVGDAAQKEQCWDLCFSNK